jgi:hypothetical protein
VTVKSEIAAIAHLRASNTPAAPSPRCGATNGAGLSIDASDSYWPEQDSIEVAPNSYTGASILSRFRIRFLREIPRRIRDRPDQPKARCRKACKQGPGASCDWTQPWTQTLDYELQLNGTGHRACQQKSNRLLYKTTIGYSSM